MIKYKASWIATIEEYPVESETKNKVVIGFDNYIGKVISYNKETQGAKFCDTFEEAKMFLIQKHTNAIKELESALMFSRDNLDLAESLTEDNIRKFE
jgi:hypothetical protein